jgi:hypothetical protein
MRRNKGLATRKAGGKRQEAAEIGRRGKAERGKAQRAG